MDLRHVRALLGWSFLLGAGLLLVWWAMVVLVGDWMFGVHGHWFGISRTAFAALHYGGMGLLKILIVVFFLIPYLSLRIVD